MSAVPQRATERFVLDPSRTPTPEEAHAWIVSEGLCDAVAAIVATSPPWPELTKRLIAKHMKPRS